MVRAFAAGGYDSCALSSGDVWCWGWNIDGEIGNGSNDAGISREPKKVGPWAE